MRGQAVKLRLALAGTLTLALLIAGLGLSAPTARAEQYEYDECPAFGPFWGGTAYCNYPCRPCYYLCYRWRCNSYGCWVIDSWTEDICCGMWYSSPAPC